ncbi:MAG: hypothetical protein Q8K32_09360 [Archangium sp.]|nr:hypothetical protein [Archangium sp.]
MPEPIEPKTVVAAAGASADVGTDTSTAKTETQSTSALGSVDDAKADDKGTGADGDKKVETKVDEKKPAVVELKLPDGLALDSKLVDGFKATATELGLDSAKAQKVFDTFVGFQQAQVKADNEAFAKQDAAWVDALKSDPELGGEKWDATKADIGRAAKHFKAGPALKVLEAAGLGNHVELVRFVAGVGRALREDSIAGTTTSSSKGERPSDAAVLFPSEPAPSNSET